MKNLKLITLSIVCTLGLLVSIYGVYIGHMTVGTGSYDPTFAVLGFFGVLVFGFGFAIGIIEIDPVTETETVKDPDPDRITFDQKMLIEYAQILKFTICAIEYRVHMEAIGARVTSGDIRDHVESKFKDSNTPISIDTAWPIDVSNQFPSRQIMWAYALRTSFPIGYSNEALHEIARYESHRLLIK